MSFEELFSQHPISQSIISKINSINDIKNLTVSSPDIFNHLSNITIKKTFNMPSNTLIIRHEKCNNEDFTGQWEKIYIVYNNVKYKINNFYEQLTKHMDGCLEYIHTIRVELNDSYQTYIFPKLQYFFTSFGSFIDGLFDLLPNAIELNLYCRFNMHLILIKNLTSSKIKVISGIDLDYFSDNIQGEDFYLGDFFNGLSELNEIHIYFKQVGRYLYPPYINIIYDIIRYLSTKEGNKLVINADNDIYTMYFYEEILCKFSSFDINLSLDSYYSEERIFRSDLSNCDMQRNVMLHHVVEFKYNIKCRERAECLFISLLNLTNLKILRIEVNERFVLNELKIGIDFNEKLFENISNVEELYLTISNMKYIYNEDDTNQNFDDSMLYKNEFILKILKNLKDKLKILYLSGVPNLTKEMSEIIKVNCPRITDLYIEPFLSVDVDILKEMKKLKFVYLKNVEKLIIPRNVQMVIFESEETPESRMIAKMNDNQSYEYFKEKFNRKFKISIRSCEEGYHKHNVFFDNIFHGNMYLKKVYLYKKK